MSSPNNDQTGNIFGINDSQDALVSVCQPALDDLTVDQQLILGYLTVGIPADQIADLSETLEPQQVTSGLDSIDKPAATLEIFIRLIAQERKKREQLALLDSPHTIVAQRKHLKRVK